MRTILFDTHLLLWSQFQTEKLSPNIRSLLQDSKVRWQVSQISLWEIQVKYDLGKLPLPKPPSECFPEMIKASGLAYTTLQNEAIFMLGKLPKIHRDPFDHLLITTAIVNGWEIATVDTAIEQYPVRTVS